MAFSAWETPLQRMRVNVEGFHRREQGNKHRVDTTNSGKRDPFRHTPLAWKYSGDSREYRVFAVHQIVVSVGSAALPSLHQSGGHIQKVQFLFWSSVFCYRYNYPYIYIIVRICASPSSSRTHKTKTQPKRSKAAAVTQHPPAYRRRLQPARVPIAVPRGLPAKHTGASRTSRFPNSSKAAITHMYYYSNRPLTGV